MQNKKSIIFTLIFLIGILFVAAVVTYGLQQKAVLEERDTEATQTLNATEETPYTNLDGELFSFTDYRGQVRVVNTWASWSPFSADELKDLERLAVEYADQSVTVIAVNRKETKEKAAAYLGTLQTFNELVFAIDITDAFYTSVGGYAMPETIFYDERGNIVFHQRGVMSYEEMQRQVEAALAATK